LAEVVDHERTALVAEPNGREFAAAMLRVMTDAGLRGRLSEAGRREVQERFSAERMVERTQEVYEDVVGKRGKR
jgi:glycosyltransferase involved in cell wall biosynthesis